MCQVHASGRLHVRFASFLPSDGRLFRNRIKGRLPTIRPESPFHLMLELAVAVPFKDRRLSA